MTSISEKMANFQLFFSVQGTGGSPMGPDAENRVGDQENRSPDRPVCCGLDGTLSCKKKTTLASFPRSGVFPSKVLQLNQQRRLILRVNSLALWKIIDVEGAVLIPKNIESRTFPAEFFGGGRHREVSWANDLSAPLVYKFYLLMMGC
jgi:hypothetical protein